MAHQMPRRHGIDWGRQQPSPSHAPGSRGATAGKIQTGYQQSMGPTPIGQEPSCVQVLPVKMVDAFYQNLPDPGVQPIVRTTEVRWDASRVAGATFDMVKFTVPSQYVYVLTDIFYYGLAPSSVLEGPMVSIGAPALAGLIRFELLINGRATMRVDSSTVNPYDAASAAAIDRSGWGFLETEFGTRRGGGFALYAKSQQEVLVRANIDVTPRFIISKVGAHMHGFAVPETLFETLFKRPTSCLPLGQQQSYVPAAARSPSFLSQLTAIETLIESAGQYDRGYPVDFQYDDGGGMQTAYDPTRLPQYQRDPSVVVTQPIQPDSRSIQPDVQPLSQVITPRDVQPSADFYSQLQQVQPTQQTSRTIDPSVTQQVVAPTQQQLVATPYVSMIEPARTVSTPPTSRVEAEEVPYSPYIYNPSRR